MEKFLILMAGLPGTGKTTASIKLSENLDNYMLIDQNKLRRKNGMKRTPKKQDSVNRKIDILSASKLNMGKGVIVDSVHRQVVRRNQLYGIASSCGKNVIIVECKCSETTSKYRMRNRNIGDGLISDPRKMGVYNKLAHFWENIGLDYRFPGQDLVSHLVYDSEHNKTYRHKVTKGVGPCLSEIEKILKGA